MVERRDYWSRSTAYSQVLQWLKAQPAGPVEELPPSVSPDVAKRILGRLAGRGLAKHEAGKWIPTSALMQPAVLKKLDR